MELYTRVLSTMLAEMIRSGESEIVFPNLDLNAKEIAEMRCYKALKEIREILDDNSLEDDSCFWRIEAIVSTFEKMGSDGGSRHDF